MNIQSIVISIYALTVLIGGAVGYVVSNSVPSIAMGTITALCLFFAAFLMAKEIKLGHQGGFYLVLALLLFFTYRFAKTSLFIPSGMMSIISLVVLIYLIHSEKKNILKI